MPTRLAVLLTLALVVGCSNPDDDDASFLPQGAQVVVVDPDRDKVIFVTDDYRQSAYLTPTDRAVVVLDDKAKADAGEPRRLTVIKATDGQHAGTVGRVARSNLRRAK